MLATAQFEAGQVENSAVTVQLAARRGWRDPLSQQAMLELALGAGDGAEAARRYAALLLNSETENELLAELAARTFSEPEGAARVAFSKIVAGGQRWHDFFLRRGSRVMPADAFTEIVVGANAIAPFDCSAVERTLEQFGNRDAPSAEQLATAFADSC